MLTVSTYAARPAVNKWPGSKAGQLAPKVEDMPTVLAKNLATFDDLDFRVYTHQQWQDLHHSHAGNVIVHWPDGRTTQGLRKHIEDLRYMWTFAPDNRIQEHPIRFGTADGEWTAVMGWLEGTFTKPMVLPGGKVIQPTGKAYRIPMATPRALGQARRHVRGVSILGWRRVHEADRGWRVASTISAGSRCRVCGGRPRLQMRLDAQRPGNPDLKTLPSGRVRILGERLRSVTPGDGAINESHLPGTSAAGMGLKDSGH
jgi:hypothetical protein